MSNQVGRIEFTSFGQQRADQFVQASRAVCFKAAATIALRYEVGVEQMVEGHRGDRDLNNGQLTPAERPHFADFLRSNRMSAVQEHEGVVWGVYGHRPTLDRLVTGYMRGKGEGAKGSRHWVRDGNPIFQESHALWMTVEYGTGPRTTSPRPDRQILRFINRHTGEEVFAKITHPSPAFRGMGFQPRNTRLNLNKFTTGMQAHFGDQDPFGLAPFRTTHYEVMGEVEGILNVAFSSEEGTFLVPHRKR